MTEAESMLRRTTQPTLLQQQAKKLDHRQLFFDDVPQARQLEFGSLVSQDP